ncbi:MAG: MBL fold metallo-hydrolase, partial [Thermoplasmata archaeon]|nr:MBL fold metallo-hydrolase [Thermoplasmata archaeon]NIS10541.1 MBL fold metallo-hydrolase [Thermoplasmata archaeon]NIS18502.1 MBL fold metallo-hydrolase [Thermoplasmata archaeon]NIT75486.1 MBL fold metallo-hydrolase [Thermoplasmata archaeon]NIU47657.1 MBL fold metallo-hydrolase [Thermoplasmata archaeon]
YDSNIMVLDGDAPVVVDCGTGNNNAFNIERIANVLEGREVDRVVLTHGHFDHAGGAAGISRHFDAPVFIHPEGIGMLASSDPQATGAWLFGAKPEPVEALPLEEGDMVDPGGSPFEVLYTPGHSLHSIALWHEPSRTLIPGDTVYADGGIGRWDLKGGDYDQLLASLTRLAGLDAESMYPGHGPSVATQAVRHIEAGLKMAKLYGGL